MLRSTSRSRRIQACQIGRRKYGRIRNRATIPLHSAGAPAVGRRVRRRLDQPPVSPARTVRPMGNRRKARRILRRLPLENAVSLRKWRGCSTPVGRIARTLSLNAPSGVYFRWSGSALATHFERIDGRLQPGLHTKFATSQLQLSPAGAGTVAQGEGSRGGGIGTEETVIKNQVDGVLKLGHNHL
jgi:hypothetical protein